ncbi:uncharacterized protein LOC127279688 isoform X2 [Leptopilina boulardi]|uniref:uncharacterized protein LOC127279688 isoform X2 n=1 Tax=Leptopilina boulardi TaxID=63433 RepID=UPI0021F552A6|nr:uncharacterized protein LOC127279688 isoform X2 [Leptopilina boulardi]
MGAERNFALIRVKFGVPLNEVCKNDIPGPLLVLILKLNKEAPLRKDIFRAPGHQGNMKKLIYFLQTGRLINMDNFSVYTIASALKKFLRKIPGGVFGREGEMQLFTVIQLESIEQQRDQIHKKYFIMEDELYVIVLFEDGMQVTLKDWTVSENGNITASYYPINVTSLELHKLLLSKTPKKDEWCKTDGQPYPIIKVFDTAKTLEAARKKEALHLQLSEVESDEGKINDKLKQSRHSRCVKQMVDEETPNSNASKKVQKRKIFSNITNSLWRPSGIEKKKKYNAGINKGNLHDDSGGSATNNNDAPHQDDTNFNDHGIFDDNLYDADGNFIIDNLHDGSTPEDLNALKPNADEVTATESLETVVVHSVREGNDSRDSVGTPSPLRGDDTSKETNPAKVTTTESLETVVSRSIGAGSDLCNLVATPGPSRGYGTSKGNVSTTKNLAVGNDSHNSAAIAGPSGQHTPRADNSTKVILNSINELKVMVMSNTGNQGAPEQRIRIRVSFDNRDKDLKKFPVQTVRDLKKMNKKLVNSNFSSKLTNALAGLGYSCNLSITVNKMMNQLFSYKVGQEYSYDGRSQKKPAFKQLRFSTIICNAVNMLLQEKQFSREDVHNSIKAWLYHCKGNEIRQQAKLEAQRRREENERLQLEESETSSLSEGEDRDAEEK